MNWKEWFEKKALFVIVSACAATGGVVAGVMAYYSSQKIDIISERHNSEMTELKTQLASITRSIGHEEYLDVRKIVVARDRVSPEPNSQYFEDAEFYAPAAGGDWAYTLSNEAALVQALAGVDVSKISFLQKTGNLAPIHLWRGKKVLDVEGDSSFRSLFPFVYVEKVSISKMKGAISSLRQDATGGAKSTSPPSPSPATRTQTNKGDELLDSLFRGDVAGNLLTMTLVGQLTMAQGMPLELLNVQKVHNVVYIAERLTLENVKVDRVTYGRFYLYSEMIIISNGDDAIMVKTLVPSSDPFGNNDSFQYLSRWFNGLRVLVG